MIELIDVSRYQGTIDWNSVAASGIVGAYIKATEGTSIVSPVFAEQVQGAQGAGLRVGVYHFLAHDVDPMAQARHFLSVYRTMDPGCFGTGCAPALDVETAWSGGDRRCADASLTWLRAARDTLGVAPMLYTYGAFARGFGACAPLAEFPLWLARYREEWPPAPSPWAEVTMHQYTGTGRVPGISGFVDRSRARD